MTDLAIIAFDLDDTLSKSKVPLDAEMAELLRELLLRFKVAVASGASFGRFSEQLLPPIGNGDFLKNLYLLPTNSASMYAYDGAWQTLYTETLPEEDKKEIMAAFEKAFAETHFEIPKTLYGTLVEDRGSQLTFSAFGSTAPLELKDSWDRDHQKREVLAAVLRRELPNFAVGIAGTTSIDVTRKGIDKAYGITKLSKHLSVPFEKILYVGDALFPGGNDAPVMTLGIHTHWVKGETPVDQTKKLIRELLSGAYTGEA